MSKEPCRKLAVFFIPSTFYEEKMLDKFSPINEYKLAATSVYKVLEDCAYDMLTKWNEENPNATAKEFLPYVLDTLQETGTQGRNCLERLALSYADEPEAEEY